MKKIIAITLAVLVAMSALVCSLTVFTAATNATISYSFTGAEASKAGFAEGTISVKNNTSSTANYYLYWADSTKALDGYRHIATLSVAAGATGTYKMLDHTAIPPKATQLIAINSSSAPTVANRKVSNAAGTYTIPTAKRLTNTTTLYDFGAFSDPQIANDSYGSNSYPHDETHWAKALETFAKRDVDFLVSSGDIVNDQNGGQTYAAEYQAYQKILANSSFVNPVYEANGNHDVHVNWKGSAAQLNKPFVMGTGVDNDVKTIKANTPYFEITEPVTGDHFIFMALEGGFYTNQNVQFSTAQLNWLEGLLKKYKDDGKNIFILEHANIEGWGSGDKASAPYYYDLGMKKTQTGTDRFIKLMETYKECVIITGHTHLELSAHLNFSDNNGTSAVMMHNSAIGGVRRLVNNAVNRDPVLGLSEGYLVDVYEDYIIFNGTNLYYNEIMP
ncbi:MAG: metallophosphoesterase, partial [Eubacteriales bacterium]|nr:metallophosphoesterase [Eubacteriales bacterium]